MSNQMTHQCIKCLELKPPGPCPYCGHGIQYFTRPDGSLDPQIAAVLPKAVRRELGLEVLKEQVGELVANFKQKKPLLEEQQSKEAQIRKICLK